MSRLGMPVRSARSRTLCGYKRVSAPELMSSANLPNVFLSTTVPAEIRSLGVLLL